MINCILQYKVQNTINLTVSAVEGGHVKITLTKDDRFKVLQTLMEVGLLPPLQGQIIINITPQAGISTIDYKVDLPEISTNKLQLNKIYRKAPALLTSIRGVS